MKRVSKSVTAKKMSRYLSGMQVASCGYFQWKSAILFRSIPYDTFENKSFSRMKFLIFLFSLFLITACNNLAEDNPVLTIEGGQIRGVKAETSGVIIYKGIPFAAPPIGENRWREPQPVQAWEGVKIADSFGNAAVQAAHKEGEFYHKEFFSDGDAPFNEDCLTLNIWTPAAGKTDAKLPVAIWIHGGAYTGGWGFEKEMDGQAWAERNVILVTINYRLGIFGFLAHPELAKESPNKVAGNYGTLDQIAALKWVHRNIEQFGGDPHKITIFGQSAGGASIKTLVASPLTKGLLSGAIIQSAGGMDKSGGDGIGDGSYEKALSTGKAIMDFGGYNTLEEMRAASADEIFNLSTKYAEETKSWLLFTPVIDGYVSKENFSTAALNGNIADIPYMIGFVSGDTQMGAALGSAEAIADFCMARADAGKNAYAYQFTRALPGDDAGAYHSSELWYIFNTLSCSWRPFIEEDYALSRIMTDAWCNFAKYGEPNKEGDKTWSQFTEDNKRFMVFGLDDNNKASAKMEKAPLPAM